MFIASGRLSHPLSGLRLLTTKVLEIRLRQGRNYYLAVPVD